MGSLRTTMKSVVIGVIGLAILAGVVWFFVWLASASWHIKVIVESAALTRFDLDSNNTLHYNLTLSVSVRNANHATVYYNRINAKALYGGSSFGAVDVPYFTQGPKTTTMIYPAFQGQASLPGDSILVRFNKEKAEGIYSVDLKLYMNILIEWTSSSDYATYTNAKRYAPEVNCAPLRVSRAGGAVTGAVFNRTICDVKL